jgi:ribonuclease BN (tRNA processing enzyme)
MRATQRVIPMRRYTLISALTLLSIPSTLSAQTCTGNPVAVQILGSGGPRINPDRASTSYLLWINNQAKLLIDTGGGAFFRFGQSQAKLSDLALVGVTHLHPDHVSDLPALLWTSQAIRKDPLPIFGPSGSPTAPDFAIFLNRLFDEKTGAFQVLGPALGGAPPALAGSVRIMPTVVDVTKSTPSTLFDQQGLTVTALGIPHGDMPTLAYKVRTRDLSVVFSSDQTGTNPAFVDFAKGANVLIMHFMVGAAGTSPLHAAPAVIGRIARIALTRYANQSAIRAECAVRSQQNQTLTLRLGDQHTVERIAMVPLQHRHGQRVFSP